MTSHLSSPEKKAAYQQSLAQLNLKDAATSVDKVKSRGMLRGEDEAVKPPQSLNDIFKISNRNRKKNKQKKKVCKFDSSIAADAMSTNSSENFGPVDNVNQIIALQYKIDQQEGRAMNGLTLQQIKQLDDYEFMN